MMSPAKLIHIFPFRQSGPYSARASDQNHVACRTVFLKSQDFVLELTLSVWIQVWLRIQDEIGDIKSQTACRRIEMSKASASFKATVELDQSLSSMMWIELWTSRPDWIPISQTWSSIWRRALFCWVLYLDSEDVDQAESENLILLTQMTNKGLICTLPDYVCEKAQLTWSQLTSRCEPDNSIA